MNVRELAVELSQLKPKDRARLLAELPPERRADIEQMLTDIESLLKPAAAPRSFEAHLDGESKRPAERQPDEESFASFNEGQIRLLLGTEHPAVQQRVIRLVRSRQLGSLATAVRSVVQEHLSQRLSATHLHAGSGRVKAARWWHRLGRRA